MDALLKSPTQTEATSYGNSIEERPERLVALTTTDKYSFSEQDLEAIQLTALKKRFSELIDTVPVLARFAETQGLKEINRLEDGALLLLPHTMYKSYPLSAIESGRFDRMTKWLDTLTAHDLSKVDTASCDSIDAWIDTLDAQTEVRLRHSSGTTGKLSFIPGNVAETYTNAMGIARFFQGFGDEADADAEPLGKLPLLCCGHRRGAMATARTLDSIQHHFYNDDESMIITTNPGRFSADMLSLGGRLEAAQSRGELGKLQLSPALLARREAFIKEQEEAPKRLEAFFETIRARFEGKEVIVKGVVPMVVDTAVAGLQRGLERVFAPNSFMFIAGGPKGRTLPDDYPSIVERWSGIPYPLPGYGMSEAGSAITRMCPAGRYHIPPNLIPYLIHPKTGEILPRSGRQTGRYGIIDVAALQRWGGFLTGDEITLNFGDHETCSCGRKGTFIEGDIRRYSEGEGGDDKITCAGAPGVHDKALEFISGAVG